MSSHRPKQTDDALMKPKNWNKPCIRNCGRTGMPGQSYCRECHNAARRERHKIAKEREQ